VAAAWCVPLVRWGGAGLWRDEATASTETAAMMAAISQRSTWQIIRDLSEPFRQEPPARTLALHAGAPDARPMRPPKTNTSPPLGVCPSFQFGAKPATSRPADFHGQIRCPATEVNVGLTPQRRRPQAGCKTRHGLVLGQGLAGTCHNDSSTTAWASRSRSSLADAVRAEPGYTGLRTGVTQGVTSKTADSKGISFYSYT
jgi:hypothetical protein